MTDILILEVTRDGWTKGLQLNIAKVDADDGTGHGYRIAGPKFNGSQKLLLSHTLDARDAAEIRAYLDAVFPDPEVAKLKERAAFLDALEANGVDNWEGYGLAFEDDDE